MSDPYHPHGQLTYFWATMGNSQIAHHWGRRELSGIAISGCGLTTDATNLNPEEGKVNCGICDTRYVVVHNHKRKERN